MFISQLFFSIIVGISLGIITGLIPGIHINLVSVILFSVFSFKMGFADYSFSMNPLSLACVMIAMSTTHTILDFIPSIFLGAPSEATALSVLPGHRMLLRGEALKAIYSTIVGISFSLIIGVLLLPIMIPLLSLSFNMLKGLTPIILIVMSLLVIINHKSRNQRFWALVIFLFSGTLGVFGLKMPNLNQPLLPLFSGLFGISTLLRSLSSNAVVPEQKLYFELKTNIKPSFVGFLLGMLTAIFPALTSSQVAMLSLLFFKRIKESDFLNVLGAVNMSNLLLTIVGLLVVGKARSGVLVVMSKFISINLHLLLVLACVVLITSGLSILIAIKVSTLLCKFITRINYGLLSILIILVLFCVTFVVSGFIGVLVLVVSSFIGLLAHSLGVRKVVCMGSLIMPIITYYV